MDLEKLAESAKPDYIRGLPFTIDFKRMMEKSLSSLPFRKNQNLLDIVKFAINNGAVNIDISENSRSLTINFDGDGVSTKDDLIKTIYDLYSDNSSDSGNKIKFSGFGRALLACLADRPKAIKVDTHTQDNSLCMIVDEEFKPLIFEPEEKVDENRITITKSRSDIEFSTARRRFENGFFDGLSSVASYTKEKLSSEVSKFRKLDSASGELANLVEYFPGEILYNGKRINKGIDPDKILIQEEYEIEGVKVILTIPRQNSRNHGTKTTTYLKNHISLLTRPTHSFSKDEAHPSHEYIVQPNVIVEAGEIELNITRSSIHEDNEYKKVQSAINEAILKFYEDCVLGKIELQNNSVNDRFQLDVLTYHILTYKTPELKSFDRISSTLSELNQREKLSEDDRKKKERLERYLAYELFEDIDGRKYTIPEIAEIVNNMNNELLFYTFRDNFDRDNRAFKPFRLEDRKIIHFDSASFQLFNSIFNPDKPLHSFYYFASHKTDFGGDALSSNRLLSRDDLEKRVEQELVNHKSKISFRTFSVHNLDDELNTYKNLSKARLKNQAEIIANKGLEVVKYGVVTGASLSGVGIAGAGLYYGVPIAFDFITSNPEIPVGVILTGVGGTTLVKYRRNIGGVTRGLFDVGGNAAMTTFNGLVKYSKPGANRIARAYYSTSNIIISGVDKMSPSLRRAIIGTYNGGAFLAGIVAYPFKKLAGTDLLSKIPRRKNKSKENKYEEPDEDKLLSGWYGGVNSRRTQTYIKSLSSYLSSFANDPIPNPFFRLSLLRIKNKNTIRPFRAYNYSRKIGKELGTIEIRALSDSFEDIVDAYHESEGLSLFSDLRRIGTIFSRLNSQEYLLPALDELIINTLHSLNLEFSVAMVANGDQEFINRFSKLRNADKKYVLKRILEFPEYGIESQGQTEIEEHLKSQYEPLIEEVAQELISNADFNRLDNRIQRSFKRTDEEDLHLLTPINERDLFLEFDMLTPKRRIEYLASRFSGLPSLLKESFYKKYGSLFSYSELIDTMKINQVEEELKQFDIEYFEERANALEYLGGELKHFGKNLASNFNPAAHFISKLLHPLGEQAFQELLSNYYNPGLNAYLNGLEDYERFVKAYLMNHDYSYYLNDLNFISLGQLVSHSNMHLAKSALDLPSKNFMNIINFYIDNHFNDQDYLKTMRFVYSIHPEYFIGKKRTMDIRDVYFARKLDGSL